MDEQIAQLTRAVDRFLQGHRAGEPPGAQGGAPLTGEYALYQGRPIHDLYGMVDAVYILFTLGELAERTDRASRRVWADRILDCQDDRGRFSKRNLRGHGWEHASAYAASALRLLEIEDGEQYVDDMQPLVDLLPILTNRAAFARWINALGFRPSPREIARKNLGWHYIWRGSHVGGGVAALVGLAGHLFDRWWPDQVDTGQWFRWYFEWLDAQANPGTGYWQRAFWNLVYRKPTLIDMGGAVHFFWIYEALERPFPHPEAVIASTLSLQREDGLYKDHPFCIDLDGDFCVLRAFLQLPEATRRRYQERVQKSLEASFEGVVSALTEQPLEQIYTDSHGLPGALAALTECTKLPGFKHSGLLDGWQHPLDQVWWL